MKMRILCILWRGEFYEDNGTIKILLWRWENSKQRYSLKSCIILQNEQVTPLKNNFIHKFNSETNRFLRFHCGCLCRWTSQWGYSEDEKTVKLGIIQRWGYYINEDTMKTRILWSDTLTMKILWRWKYLQDYDTSINKKMPQQQFISQIQLWEISSFPVMFWLSLSTNPTIARVSFYSSSAMRMLWRWECFEDEDTMKMRILAE